MVADIKTDILIRFMNSLGREGIKALRKRVAGLPDDPYFDELLFLERKKLETGGAVSRAEKSAGLRALLRTRAKILCASLSPTLYKMIFPAHLYLFSEKAKS